MEREGVVVGYLPFPKMRNPKTWRRIGRIGYVNLPKGGIQNVAGDRQNWLRQSAERGAMPPFQ